MWKRPKWHQTRLRRSPCWMRTSSWDCVAAHVECELVHCNTPQPIATDCNTLQHTATSRRDCVAAHVECVTAFPLQHTTTHCNGLQYTATHCTTTGALHSRGGQSGSSSKSSSSCFFFRAACISASDCITEVLSSFISNFTLFGDESTIDLHTKKKGGRRRGGL